MKLNGNEPMNADQTPIARRSDADPMHEFPLPPSGRSNNQVAAQQYKEVVRMLAKCDRAVKLAGPVAIECVIYRDKRFGPPVAYLPELIAAMQGVFFDRSDQLVELSACLAYDRHRPRVEVAVRPVLE